MKLLYCKKCGDVFNLKFHIKKCYCAESEGYYIDEINAKYNGDCIPIGIDNHSFRSAINLQPQQGLGKRFDAFVIPKECETFTKVEIFNENKL
jgi:hypothetical protein